METAGLLNRYFWLADLVYRSGRITREEINRRWAASALNTSGESEIAERTFHRHKTAIRELLGMDITCDRHDPERTYRVANRDEIEYNGALAWLFDSFAIGNTVRESKDLRGRILFEHIPAGRLHLSTITDAMLRSVRLNLTYRSFHCSKDIEQEIAPYCLKAFRQRWYMLGLPIGQEKARIFALDRITAASATESRFNLPEDFDAEAVFKDCFGVIIGGNEKAQYVEIEARDGQRHYIRSLPLHPSQQETVSNEFCSTFVFYLRPTFDFIQELLQFGNGVEVVQPRWLREKMKAIAKDMSESYE